MKNDLLPLFLFHTKDKRLSFLTLMLLVQLTELPHKDCNEKTRIEIFKHLHQNKLHFLAPKAIATLMDQLMEILNVDKDKGLNEK